MKRTIEPAGWARARGYVNGVAARGEVVFVAGQIGWSPAQRFETDDFIAQFAQALDNVLAVVAAAGGGPTDVVEMTVFVTDIAAYRARTAELGPVWQARLGKHYPAMALVAVTALVEPRAQVEIRAVAVLEES